MSKSIDASKLVKKAVDEKADEEVAKEKALEAIVPSKLEKYDAMGVVRRSNRMAIELKGVRVKNETHSLATNREITRLFPQETWVTGNGLNQRLGGKVKYLALEINWYVSMTEKATTAITIVQLWFGQLIGAWPKENKTNKIKEQITNLYWPTSEPAIAPWSTRRGYVNKNFKIFKRYNLQFRQVLGVAANTKQGNNLSQTETIVINANDLGNSKMLDSYFYELADADPEKTINTQVNPLIVGCTANVQGQVRVLVDARVTYVC